MGLEMCTVRSQGPAEAGSSTPLAKTARSFHVHIHQSVDVGYSEREHDLRQGGPLQLIQSLEGLTTEGNLLPPLPAAGAMSPFLIGDLGSPSQSPPYLLWETSHLPTQLSVKSLVIFNL